MNRPVVITMGCPVGVGPEIICKYFAAGRHRGRLSTVVLGDLGVLQQSAALLGINVCPVGWRPGSDVAANTIPVMDLSTLAVDTLQWGRPTKATSLAMAAYIRAAVQGTMSGDFAAMVTCPISKKALNEAGVHFPGHTEMLAELTAVADYRMMMAGDRLRVVLATIHEPLAKVSAMVTAEELSSCIAMTAASLRRDFALIRPRIGVAGLNPHSGEQGMFGREEIDIIEPVIRQYCGDAVVSGPWPPDTVFYKAASGEFDAVIAMYHDQGLIPFKLLHFKDGVNVTLGLPIVRTSVDHGTAYDIAGQGRADPASLTAACALAEEITENRAEGIS